ncbi:MAG: hypothetical protein ACOC3V_03755 [bacterium]
MKVEYKVKQKVESLSRIFSKFLNKELEVKESNDLFNFELTEEDLELLPQGLKKHVK